MKSTQQKDGSAHSLDLLSAVMWATPQAADSYGGKGQPSSLRTEIPQLWATPNAGDALGSHGGGQSSSLRTDISDLRATPQAASCGMTAKTGGSAAEKTTKLPSRVNNAELWRTPNALDSKNRGTPEYRQGRQIQLQTEVQELWSTPTVNDAKNCSLPPSQGKRRSSVTTEIIKAGGKGSLNPDWVELLMGWPIGWTALGGFPTNLRLKWGLSTHGNRRALRQALRTERGG